MTEKLPDYCTVRRERVILDSGIGRTGHQKEVGDETMSA